ncbi:hypothetical protein GGX14DRAFT_396320 [Mycena pura]|uniref:Uncharacterized protein n=1 Tax=Mycena pura TaxID=153505 RepID=A0AAD6Y8N4_9AGAR|nr:hypothetical protein GGX14DRAFT_396320 [Mycena pura]
MKFFTLSALVAVAIAHQTLAQVTFVVSPSNTNTDCDPGTAISCSQDTITADACKGNFTPGQRCLHIAATHPDCHVSLYTEDNQQGGVQARLSTASGGSIIEASDDEAAWLSYGIFCP